MPVLRVREIYYLIETAFWFWFICVRIHWALPGILHRKSSVWRVLCTSLSLHRASQGAEQIWSGPPLPGCPQLPHLKFSIDKSSWKTPLNCISLWMKILQKEMCQKTLQKLSQKLDLPPSLSNEIVLALYFWLLPVSRRTAMLRVSYNWLLYFSTNPKINF